MKPLSKYHLTFKTEGGQVVETWGIFPIGQTKILDGIYDPVGKRLTLVLDSVVEKYTEMPVQVGKKVENQLRKVDRYYEISIPEQDIPHFLENYVENNFEIDAKIHYPKKEGTTDAEIAEDPINSEPALAGEAVGA